MKKSKLVGFCRTVAGAAVVAAFAPVHAQDAADSTAAKPDMAAVGVGLGLASGSNKDRALFGQYNGLRNGSTHLLLDFDYVRRNEDTGQWTILRGRNLGLDTRELGATVQRQGDWKFSADYNEIVRWDPRTANTGLTGAGTTTPTINRLASPGSGTDLEFHTKREILNLAGEKWIFPGLQFEVNFKNEDKDGTRRWGRGYDCAATVCRPAASPQSATNQTWAVLMVPEPISFNTKQVDAKFNFTTDKLFVSAGYYGSFFNNDNGNITLNVPAALNGPTAANTTGPAIALTTAGQGLRNVLQLPMALPPDNQAHQFFVNGNYAFTPKVRSTFKVAYTHATQNESFGAMGFTAAPAGRTDAGAVLNTTLAQFGITAKPLPKLSLLGNVRYEKKDDKTAIAAYNVEGASTWNNNHISNTKLSTKAEASYLLPANVRGTVGIDYDQVKRELPGLDVQIAGLSGLRGKTEETTYRLDLRRSISETVTGSVGVAHASRTGSDWYNLCTNVTAAPPVGCLGLTYGNTYSAGQIYQHAGQFPYLFTDRKRDKVKGSIDWLPTDRLSLTFLAETSQDKYTPPSDVGLRKAESKLYSVDAAYTVSDKWKLTAYGSLGDQTMRMGAGNLGYMADIKDRNTALGFGVVGTPTGVLQVGANVTYLSDVNKYNLQADPNPNQPLTAANVTTLTNNTAQAALGLPDVTYRQTRFNLYGQYALDKRSDIRVDFVYVSTKLDEWTWGGNGLPLFTYQDNTTINMNANQHVTFIGARYIYKF